MNFKMHSKSDHKNLIRVQQIMINRLLLTVKLGGACKKIPFDQIYIGLVFSTTGGMGPQATMFLKRSRVATLLAAKTSQDKSLIMANLRRCLRFELLKTILIAVRGHRGRYYEKAIPVDELDLNLAHTTNDEDRGDDVDGVGDEVVDEVENVEEEVSEE